MKDLKNKIFVVTGSTGGIGKAICRMLSNKGAIVLGINRQQEVEGEYVTEQFHADISSSEEAAKVIKCISSKYGAPDYLIHCAGLLIPGEFKNLDNDQVNSVVNSNLLSLLNIIKSTIPFFESKEKGHFIIIGSEGGIVPMPYSALYSSMKFAVRGFCLSIAEELKSKRINMSVISTGPVRTGMLETESYDDNAVITFIQKPLMPDKVAEEVLSVIDKPILEKVVPGYSRPFTFVLNTFPSFFMMILPLLNIAGIKGLAKYRKQLINGVKNEYSISC